MIRSKIILLSLLLTIIAQAACESASRAEEKTSNLPGGQNSSDANSIKIQSPFSAQNKTVPSPKPTPEKTGNAVCGNPSNPCQHKQKAFDKWELSFQMPAHLTANKTYSSAPFYAVIVKQYEEGCADLDENSLAEPERLKLQKRFPANKVFAEYSCPNLSAVSYDFSGKLDAAGEKILYMDYIAVYAGDSVDEANRLRDELIEEFPQAKVKKMTATFKIIEQ